MENLNRNIISDFWMEKKRVTEHMRESYKQKSGKP